MGEKQREILFDGRVIPSDHHDIWDLVNHSPIKNIIVTVEQRKEGHYPLKNQLITEIHNESDLTGLASGEIVLSNSQSLLEIAKQHGYKTCVFFSVDNRQLLEQSWQDAGKYDFAIVDFDLPTNIPLELIIARLEGSSTVLLRKVNSVTDMEVAFGVMEKGSDGVLFSTTDTAEIVKLINYLNGQQKSSRLDLHPLVVTEVRHVGMGIRACVDTTGLMTQDEGMIVGSTSGGGIFVCSETHYLPYMNLRPFRVNAGAIHSYIWMPDNAAEYLSDLTVGSKVLCVNTQGETRELTVGRVKIEVRPLLLISGVAADRELNVIVQDDWHIRVMGADGKPRNASMIRPGDELLSYVCEPGRHVGIKVKETIHEK
jgi:3-dehydroquinate synthase II/3-amino-4-hydroxybenzoic acid synthase